jgi:hypothetical protein
MAKASRTCHRAGRELETILHCTRPASYDFALLI